MKQFFQAALSNKRIIVWLALAGIFISACSPGGCLEAIIGILIAFLIVGAVLSFFLGGLGTVLTIIIFIIFVTGDSCKDYMKVGGDPCGCAYNDHHPAEGELDSKVDTIT